MGFSKVIWIESIHRIRISKTISLSSVSPSFTLFFAFLILGDIPTVWQLIGIVPMLLGVYVLTRPSKLEQTAL